MTAPNGRTSPESASPASSDVPAELRAAAALLAARGRVEVPNAQGNDTDPIDTAPLVEWLEEIAAARGSGHWPDLNIIGELAAIAFARSITTPERTQQP